MKHLSQHVESLIFSSEQPITPKEIKTIIENAHDQKVKVAKIIDAVESLKERYQDEQYSFEIVEIDDGYQFLTKPDYFESVAAYLKQTTKKRLSTAALETLSIVAYKQPVTKIEAEKIRGVSCDYSIQKLLEKELIEISGRSEGPGRALLYSTSNKFMDYFGLKSLSDLPKLKEFNNPENTIGEAAPIEETIPLAENGAVELGELDNTIPQTETDEINNELGEDNVADARSSEDEEVTGIAPQYDSENVHSIEGKTTEEIIEHRIEDAPEMESKPEEAITEENTEEEITEEIIEHRAEDTPKMESVQDEAIIENTEEEITEEIIEHRAGDTPKMESIQEEETEETILPGRPEMADEHFEIESSQRIISEEE